MGATAYKADYYEWTIEQAQLLKENRLGEIDLANLIEEVESMGASERNEFAHRLEVLLMHLLKWQYQADYPYRRSWQLTIIEQRKRLAARLRKSPSLKHHASEELTDAYDVAKIGAERETGLPESTFPTECPWSFEQVMNPDFMPD
ncbi:DUF29 domain-containing protein [Thiothrix subterranea]|uniref:DUF29 domain-containing protein n=1 Tax=Thiothrix subterranea TaxID=2735563 RepID=A0AA51QZB8_9GAMM|nr:DUF29 domain-containing protein [Thiothrix subterranea]MDQ5770480.1 DUF29 domain-containing protein [Thiothrix subterranea]WML86842.1 DUF29 domain-containing protein [Thiothrix subterranea]